MSVRVVLAALALPSGSLALPAAASAADPDNASCAALRDGDREFVAVNSRANALISQIPRSSGHDAQLGLITQIAGHYRTMASGLAGTAGKIADPDIKQAVLSTEEALLRYAQSADDFVAAKGDVPVDDINGAEADIDAAKQAYRAALDACGLPSA